MPTAIDTKRKAPFPLNLSDDERADLEAFVEQENARMAIGKVTLTDVIRVAVREYLDRNLDKAVSA